LSIICSSCFFHLGFSFLYVQLLYSFSIAVYNFVTSFLTNTFIHFFSHFIFLHFVLFILYSTWNFIFISNSHIICLFSHSYFLTFIFQYWATWSKKSFRSIMVSHIYLYGYCYPLITWTKSRLEIVKKTKTKCNVA
jgi:hypothetical protein